MQSIVGGYIDEFGTTHVIDDTPIPPASPGAAAWVGFWMQIDPAPGNLVSNYNLSSISYTEQYVVAYNDPNSAMNTPNPSKWRIGPITSVMFTLLR